MQAVMGIDAAWTASEPSGVALARNDGQGWRLVAVESSYQRFEDVAHGLHGDRRPSGSKPDAGSLLSSARALCGGDVDVVAIDMPLAMSPIIGRRASNNAVSSTYGSRWASTHTPSVMRPGPVSDQLRLGFAEKGYSLITDRCGLSGLIEVYPHPAIIEFARAKVRSPYKFQKRRKYWPTEDFVTRKTNILREWEKIAILMENEISGVVEALPLEFSAMATGFEWKAYEDMLDAVVCVAVGICFLENRAVPFGDEDSAIWIPKPGCTI